MAITDPVTYYEYGADASGTFIGLVPVGTAVQIVTCPPPFAGNWVWENRTWVRAPLSLAELKDEKWDNIKDRRDKELRGTFDCNAQKYDINVVEVAAAALSASRAIALGKAFSRRWVLANNNTVTLGASQVLDMSDACDAATQTIRNIAIDLRTQIYAATTKAAVRAISWPV